MAGGTSVSPENLSPARGGIGFPAAKDLAPGLVFAVLLIGLWVGQPGFFSGAGFQVLSLQTVPVLFLALGQMLVLRIGGIDLSNAAISVLAAVVLAMTLPSLGAGAIVLTLAVGAGVGMLNGIVARYFQVPTFAVTLGALGVWQAVALVLSDATTVYIDENSELISWLSDYSIFGLVSAFWIAVLVAIALSLLLRYTALGTALTVVGFNERASILSNVPVGRTRVWAFGLSGLLGAASGICFTAQQGTATASGYGVGLLLPSIAAAIVGGCLLTGGIGRPLNVVVGALIVTLIPIGSAVVGVQANIQQLVYGVIVLIATALTMARRKAA